MSAVPHPSPLSAAYAKAWRARTRRSALRRLARVVAFALVGFALATAAAATVPTLFGFQCFAVLSGSMEPAIGTGDVVVVRKIAPLDAKIGDVVTFRSPEDPGRLVTHRATSIQAGTGCTVSQPRLSRPGRASWIATKRKPCNGTIESAKLPSTATPRRPARASSG